MPLSIVTKFHEDEMKIVKLGVDITNLVEIWSIQGP